MQRLFLTFFYSGLSPYAPGTVGSILAGITGFVLLQFFHTDTLLLLTILITVVGIKEIDKYEKKSGTHDDKSIVIDEVIGLWIAFVLSSTTITQMLLSFVYFRLFDIWKPSLIGKIDRDVKGGSGVIGDDALAGVLAGISSALTWLAIEYLKGYLK